MASLPFLSPASLGSEARFFQFFTRRVIKSTKTRQSQPPFGYQLIKQNFIRFSKLVQSIHPEMKAHRKCLSPVEIANLFQEISENESDGNELSCSNLDSDEDIRLSESDCGRI
ncbi:hypothetical protein TNCV_4498631 [Trichonephila clavipes]|nr:hypothetical protein TNCV_4498631 [Trichonephila clavipes]